MGVLEDYAGMTQEDYVKQYGVAPAPASNPNAKAPVNDGSYGYSQMTQEQIVAQHAPTSAISSSMGWLSRTFYGWTHSPDDTVAKIGAVPGMERVAEIIGKDEGLKTAIHNAALNDPTFIKGMESLQGQGLGNDFATLLEDDGQRALVEQVITKVGDGSVDSDGNDVDFSHIQKLLDQNKAGNKAGMFATLQSIGITPPGMGFELLGEFLQEFFENPEMAINNLFNTLQENGYLDGIDMAHQDMMRGVLLKAAPGMAFIAKPYHEFAVKHDLGAETPGRVMANLEQTGQAGRLGKTITDAARTLTSGKDDGPRKLADGAGDTTVVGGEAGDDLSGDTAYRSPASAIGRDHYANNPSSITAEQTAGGIDAYKVKSPEAFKAAVAEGTSVGQQVMDQANEVAGNVVRATPQAYAMT